MLTQQTNKQTGSSVVTQRHSALGSERREAAGDSEFPLWLQLLP